MLTKKEFIISRDSEHVLLLNGTVVTVSFPTELETSFYEIAFRGESGFGNKVIVERKMGTGAKTSYSVSSYGGIMKVEGFALPESLDSLLNHHKTEFASDERFSFRFINSTSSCFFF